MGWGDVGRVLAWSVIVVACRRTSCNFMVKGHRLARNSHVLLPNVPVADTVTASPATGPEGRRARCKPTSRTRRAVVVVSVRRRDAAHRQARGVIVPILPENTLPPAELVVVNGHAPAPSTTLDNVTLASTCLPVPTFLLI